jgi:hypothetical protein
MEGIQQIGVDARGSLVQSGGVHRERSAANNNVIRNHRTAG